jgi:putative hemolysin|tara:strand:+ start:175 stop:387 length:213 start_codon:yes stop_codon:yes gene_type:complete
MKILLTLVICSFATGDCIAPHTVNKSFKDMHDCLMNGYQMAQEKTKEIGREEVNKHGIYVKFYCKSVEEI